MTVPRVAPPPAAPAAESAPIQREAVPQPGDVIDGRLVSLDAARGLAIAVMLLAMHPGTNQHDPGWLQHPDWHGLSFADLFFPLFLFAIGTSMTLSARAADLRHVLRRAALLALLGIALASLKHERLALTGVLQHIAIAYVLAFAVLRAPRRWHAWLAGAVVAAYWGGFVLWAWGDDPWGRAGTLAHGVNEAVFGGFTTEGLPQSAVSVVAVVGGAVAGHLVRRRPDRRALARGLAVRAVVLVGTGLVLALAVPINKRLWSPSFAVLTIGTSFAWLALGVRLIDVARRGRLVAPLVHLGTNPIAVYVVAMAALALLNNHADGVFPDVVIAGSRTAGALLYASAWLVLGWAFAYLLYRRRILIKI